MFRGGPAAATGRTKWLPDAGLIAELEKQIKSPDGASALTSYTRYYAGTVQKRHRIVVGTYLGASGQVIIVKSVRDIVCKRPPSPAGLMYCW